MTQTRVKLWPREWWLLWLALIIVTAISIGAVVPVKAADDPPQAAAAAAPASYALLAQVPDWTTDIQVAAGPDSAASVNLSNCCYPLSLHVPAGGVRIAPDAGRSIGVAPNGFVMLNLGVVDPGAAVTVRASHSSGMRLYFPVFRNALTAYGQSQRASGLVNLAEKLDSHGVPIPDDLEHTRVWVYQAEGSRSGSVTIIVLDKDGHEIARDWHAVVPGRLDSFLLSAAIPDGGSVIDQLGLLSVTIGFPGVNDPASAPDGLTFVWYTQGPETGSSAPRVVLPVSN